MKQTHWNTTAPIAVLVFSLVTGVAAAQQTAPEKTPGDIPDTQAFVTFTSSPGGYALEVPEGWARTARGPNVRFVEKLDGVEVTVTRPRGANVVAAEVAALKKSGRGVQVARVRDVRLSSGRAVRVDYTSNSEANPVTGKRVRLENVSYIFSKNGKLATLSLWAPLGADNVDQWRRIAQSFRWVSGDRQRPSLAADRPEHRWL
jgi:hypothetical protein